MSTLLNQTKHGLRAALYHGDLPCGEVLPTAKELAIRMQASPATVERALVELAREGVLHRVRRKGTLAERLPLPPLGRVCFLQSHDSHKNEIITGPLVEAFDRAGFGVDLVGGATDMARAFQDCERLRSQPDSVNTLISLWTPTPRDPRCEQFLGQFDHVIFIPEAPTPVLYPDAYWVAVDMLQMARDVTEHLLRLGHRRFIVDVGTRMEEYSPVHDAAELCRHLAEIRDGSVIPITLMRDDVSQIVDLLRTGEASAYWSITDFEALRVINECHRLGMQIPRDASIVGRNDTPWCTQIRPAITSPSLNPVATAAAVVRICLALLEGREREIPRVTRIKPHLVVRDSTGSHVPR